MKVSTDKQKIKELLERGVEEVFDKKHLEKELLSGRQLRIKHGVDPTGSKIHIGRATQYWKLKAFQDLGHQIVIIIGDFTARIGDASDKESMRRPLTDQEIEENFKNYTDQIGKVLDMEKVEVRYNSEWLAKISPKELVALMQNFTAQQLIQRRNFKERWEAGKPIGLHEICYPIFQGYDSVAIKADVETGGSDQLFNLGVGRQLQELFKQPPQDIMTLKMVWGLDGRKMSTSWGNVINMTDEPKEMFGKVMSMKDEHIMEYFQLCTNLEMEKVDQIQKDLIDQGNFRDAKALLAQTIVSMYHGSEAGQNAASEFDRIFKDKEMPEDIQEVKVSQDKLNILDLLVETKLAPSKQEAKRLVVQGGIKINNSVVSDFKQEIEILDNMIVQKGKRIFVKIKQ